MRWAHCTHPSFPLWLETRLWDKPLSPCILSCPNCNTMFWWYPTYISKQLIHLEICWCNMSTVSYGSLNYCLKRISIWEKTEAPTPFKWVCPALQQWVEIIHPQSPPMTAEGSNNTCTNLSINTKVQPCPYIKGSLVVPRTCRRQTWN